MLLHDPEHRLSVLRVLAERTLHLRHPGRLRERAAGHDRGDGAGKAAALIGVVSKAHRHEQGAEVGVAKPKRTQRLRVLADRGSGVGGVGDDDLLAGEADVDGAPKPVDVDLAVLGLELHEVQGQKVAGGVVQEDELRARVGGIDAARVRDHVPVLDRGVELQPRVPADPCRLGDVLPEVTRLVGVDDPAVDDRFGRPLLAVGDSLHELVGDSDRVVGVLELDRVVGAAGHVEADVVAGLDERPRLLLLVSLAADEVEDVGVVGVEDDHLGRPARRAARLDRSRERVVALHEGDRARCRSAA